MTLQRKTTREDLLRGVKRVVVKIGSGVIASPEHGLDPQIIQSIADQICQLKRAGYEILIVSSGAIASGVSVLNLKEPPKSIPQKQAAAAVGQSYLIWMYERSFSRHGQKIAQILLTHSDLSHRQRYLNARNTLLTLLHYQVIPIINENDTVSVEEIKFGDNDALSALMTNMVEADLLLILSDIDGLFTANPKEDSSAHLIPLVTRITPDVEMMATRGSSTLGTGGMLSKVQTAKKAGDLGVPTVVVNGRVDQIMAQVLRGEEVGTLFLPKEDRLQRRKHWIAYTLKIRGQIRVDEGAKMALTAHGKSLLPSGISEVIGTFQFGDSVSCIDPTGEEFARGIVNYSALDLAQIKGFDEVIHRDNLVVL